MTLNQKKIAAFGVFFVFFILQVVVNMRAMYNLHVLHREIEEEWEEVDRVQVLQDLLDEQNALLIAVADGQTVSPARSSRLLAGLSGALDRAVREYRSHELLSHTAHEKDEDSYLVHIVGPLRQYMEEYRSDIAHNRLTAATAAAYSKRLGRIRHEILLLRQSDSAFAQRALDRAKIARRQTLSNSLIISGVLFVLLILWAVYFLVNLNRQTQREIFQQKIVTAGLLAQSIAHEIRNPLGVIKSAADLLARRQGLDTQSRELAGYMVEEVRRIDELIQELLSLSRKKSAPREDADIGQIIRSVLDLTGGKLKQAGVTVNFIHNAPEVLCRCAPDQIRQVVLNLLLNAIDVSPSGGMIEITTAKKDNGYVMTFRDHGEGVAARDREKIFDLFYTTKDSGFGIGLAVVRRIVAEHGGSVQVQSRPGQGSLFTVSLPLAV